MAKVEQFLKAIPAFIPTETDRKLRKCSITTLVTYTVYVAVKMHKPNPHPN